MMSGSVLNLSIDNRYAVPFLVLVVLAMLAYFLASPLLVRPFPDRFTSDHDGQLLVRIAGQWMAVDEARSMDFRPMGIERYRGALLELEDGSWLINTGGQFVTHGQRLQRFFRQSPGPGQASTIEHCRHNLRDCRRWGSDELALDDDFALIGLPGDRYALADTGRHKVYLLDGNGEILDRFRRARFPNDLLWHDDALYLVDTNGERVRRMAVTGNRFGESTTVFRLGDHDATKRRRMPIRLAFVDDYWWLLSTDTSMKNGELFRIDPDWQGVQKIADPLLTDVAGLAPYRQGLVLAPFRGNHLLYFDPFDESLVPIEPPGLAVYLGELDAEVAERTRTTWLQVALLLALAGGFLMVGLRNARAVDGADPSAMSGHAVSFAEDQPYWFTYDTKTVSWVRNAVRAGVVSIPLMVLVMLWFTFISLSGDPSEEQADTLRHLLIAIWAMVLILGAFMVVASRELGRWSRYRLGMEGQLVLLAVDDDTVYRIEPRELQYGTNALLWGRHTIPLRLGNGKKLINDEQLDQRLMPLLQRHAERLGGLQMVRVQLARREPMTLASILLTLAMAGLMLYMKIFTG
jgi:hypothetical protein